jgi:Na+-driven multidrug efflux pump
MIGGTFWRGYWPLLLALGASQLTQQADMAMVSRLGGAASGAYAMLTRLAVVDIVLMTAMGAVASTAVAEARRGDEAARVVRRTHGLALAAGLCCCVFGICAYPAAARALAGDGEVSALIGDAIFWYSIAAPLRFLTNTSAFTLHAMGRGAMVARWKLAEFVAKTIINHLFMERLDLGFSGCFAAGAVVLAFSTLWCGAVLAADGGGWIGVPERSWASTFLRATAWEAQRIVALKTAMLTCLALFAARWLGTYDVSRLASYAAGQTFMLVLFTPFMALMRFLAFRLAALRECERAAFVRSLWPSGAPVVAGGTIFLFLGEGALGDLYGQHGPWWSTLIRAAAISLPLRYVANILRALLHARGAFSAVATADGAALWLAAIPLVVAGLSLDSPLVAYSSLIFPEAACAAWLWRRLDVSRDFGFADDQAVARSEGRDS